MSNTIRTYSELILLPSFEERFRYLKLSGKIGEETFGWERYLNQKFYTSQEWRAIRREIVIRDHGCDLGMYGHEYDSREPVYIHHMNPIATKDILDQTEYLLNPEYLISCRKSTHDAIHYGDETLLQSYTLTARRPNDTCPWKQSET